MYEEGDKFKVFIAVSYRPACISSCCKTGYRNFLEDLTNCFEQLGLKVYLAPREERWGEKRPPRDLGIRKDLNALKQAPTFIIFLDGNESDGALVELGIALGLGKRVWILRRTSEVLPSYITGILKVGLGSERIIESDSDAMDIARELA